MSESRTTCPDCGREPDTRHPDRCPRSRHSVRRLSRAAEVASQGRVVYPGVGFFVATGADGKQRPGLNPGVPFVGGTLSRSAGGMPTGTMTLMNGPPEPFDPEQKPTPVRYRRSEVAKVFVEDWGHVGRPREVILRPGVGAPGLIQTPQEAAEEARRG